MNKTHEELWWLKGRTYLIVTDDQIILTYRPIKEFEFPFMKLGKKEEYTFIRPFNSKQKENQI